MNDNERTAGDGESVDVTAELQAAIDAAVRRTDVTSGRAVIAAIRLPETSRITGSGEDG